MSWRGSVSLCVGCLTTRSTLSCRAIMLPCAGRTPLGRVAADTENAKVSLGARFTSETLSAAMERLFAHCKSHNSVWQVFVVHFNTRVWLHDAVEKNSKTCRKRPTTRDGEHSRPPSSPTEERGPLKGGWGVPCSCCSQVQQTQLLLGSIVPQSPWPQPQDGTCHLRALNTFVL